MEKAMRFYRYVCISFLLIFITTNNCLIARDSCAINVTNKTDHTLSSTTVSTNRNVTRTKITSKKTRSFDAQKENTKYTILFDLANVLIKENQLGFSKEVGYGKLASYTLTHWKNPGHRCLDMLAAISTHDNQKPHITITLNKRQLPLCLVELQEGKTTCCQAKTEIMKSIEVLDTQKYFTSHKEKKIMRAIMNAALDPAITATIIEPVKPMLQFAQKLKAAGHSIYIFANAPHELHTALKEKHSEILNIFDEIVLSSHVKSAKPDPAIFNYLLSTHNLNPQHCILIDSLEESIVTGQKLGIKGIVYDKISNVTSKLKKYGVIL